MFEARLQTYWSETDADGIVYFPNFFKFVEHAEEELFRAAGKELLPFIKEHQVWLPRVEAFSKFSKPIRMGAAIRVRLQPQIQGEKTIRFNYELVDDQTSEKLASGYVTAVCVDASLKSRPIPDAIRQILQNA